MRPNGDRAHGNVAVTHGFRHGVNGLQQETLTIFHRAAVFVGAGVQFATEGTGQR